MHTFASRSEYRAALLKKLSRAATAASEMVGACRESSESSETAAASSAASLVVSAGCASLADCAALACMKA